MAGPVRNKIVRTPVDQMPAGVRSGKFTTRRPSTRLPSVAPPLASSAQK